MHSANVAAEYKQKAFNIDAKIHPKFIPKPSKINSKPSQIDQSGAQERSENDLESKSVPRVSPQQVFGAFLAPLGRFWASFGAQLGTVLVDLGWF